MALDTPKMTPAEAQVSEITNQKAAIQQVLARGAAGGCATVGDQAVWQIHRSRKFVSGHSAGLLLLFAGSQWVRQNDHPAHDCGA